MSRELQARSTQNKLALWAGWISECRSSGQNVKAWCKENGICEQNYYRWQKQQFDLDIFANTLFLFCGRCRDRIKALYW